MDFINKIFKPKEIDNLLHIIENDNVIEVGEILSYEVEKVISLMNVWCKRVDKLISIDKEVNNEITWRSKKLLEFRGFTYQEFADLYNTQITPDEYPYYPVFNQLRKGQGGINTEKQRNRYLLLYQFDEENYLNVLLENGFDKLLAFFFGGLSKFKAYLPISKLDAHAAIIAPSGSGKTVLLETIFFRMTRRYRKYAYVLIDPHGDISRRAKLHRHLQDRLVYIDPFLDEESTPTFNPFKIKNRSLKNINNTAEMVILAFNDVLNREGGALTETMINMLEKCIYFLLKRPSSTMLDLVALLNRDETIFQEASESDSFFDDFFLKPNNKTREGLLNRIGRLMNSPILFNLLGGDSTFDLEKSLNENKVIIFNLGGLGEMSQIAFGKFIIANIKSIIRKRNKPSKQHTYCFIDECHNFLGGNESAEYILSQLRGFGLHMILANQYVEQLGNQAKSIKQNTAIKILGGGADNIDDIGKMIKVSKNAELKDFEFFLKVRGKSILKFKSPGLLLSRSSNYYLTKEEEKELNKKLLQRFYNPIGQSRTPHRKERSESLNIEEVEKSKNLNSPKPDLGLHIIEDDSKTD